MDLSFITRTEPPMPAESQREIEREIGGKISSPEGTHWICAYLGEELVGFGALKTKTKMLSHLYVYPAYRGRGIAGALIDRRIALARELGLPHVQISIKECRKPRYLALGFYDTSVRGRWHWMKLKL